MLSWMELLDEAASLWAGGRVGFDGEGAGDGTPKCWILRRTVGDGAASAGSFEAGDCKSSSIPNSERKSANDMAQCWKF
jgi:hypothetical protein